MEEPLLGDSVRTSCERCRRRKIKCDRKRPCSRCAKAGTECVLQGIGEKQRPVSKGYIQALEGQIAALEQVIHKLAVADNAERDQIISDLSLTTGAPDASLSDGGQADAKSDPSLAAARVKSGQLRRLRGGNAAQFFGGTSLLQIHFSKESSSSPVAASATGIDSLAISTDGPHYNDKQNTSINNSNSNNNVDLSDPYGDFDDFSLQGASFQYEPHHETSQKLMSTFFMEIYPYNMVVYREYFLRDYDVGSGKYYSDVLLYSICALGALQYDDMLNLSDVFSGQAQTLLYSTLDSPDLTTLQALVLLGYREIAVGRASKGWLFCGMAFRLAHEMGLHLDPTNWEGSTESSGDREILRRVYWAVFMADKQLSLYFGRPPALYPGESDVRNTIRLQYPPGWQGLLETYICKGASANEWDNGVALVGSFIYRAELSKIIHLIITDLFENRRGGADPTIIATKTRRIHLSLTKWLSNLPSFLHWNQWTVGQVPPYVLHLHMMFHTIMIILHRPPSHMFEKPGIAESEDVDICYESLQAILRLMRSFSRYYRYRSLPLDFVHTLSTAASTVMMKRFLQKASWRDPDIERALSLITLAMDEIQNTWPCVREIRDVLLQAQQTQASMPPEDPLNAPDLMNGLEVNNDDFLANLGDDDIGTLITDEFLSAQLPIMGPGLEPFDFNQLPGPS